jgi:hypothetical protein
VNGWTIAKYGVAIVGLAVVVTADRLGRREFGYAGLALIMIAFLLRFVQRWRATKGSAPR